LRARPPERDDNGNELRMFELDSVAPGQALHLTVLGLPTRQARPANGSRPCWPGCSSLAASSPRAARAKPEHATSERRQSWVMA
jgi:hypothetical protein